MEQGRTRSKWLPIVAAAAVALSNPFMLVAMGATLGLIFFWCDHRAAYRKIAGLAMLPLLALVLWLEPLLSFFALTASFIGVWTLRKNFFSTVTSNALVGCLIAVALTAGVVLETGPALWGRIEANALATQQRWQKLAVKEDPADSEQKELWEKWNRLAVKIIPGHFVLMMIASFFLSIILYRRYGKSRLPLSLGCSQFNEYRFEDNWVWLVIIGLVLALLFSANETLLRVAINILFVMGMLYIIRGLAVMFYFIARRQGGTLLRVLLVALCLTPMVMLHLVFGLLDTWVDFRRSVPATR